ncbi:hypothetical protein Tco_0697990 [Tanacetum coccineum]
MVKHFLKSLPLKVFFGHVVQPGLLLEALELLGWVLDGGVPEGISICLLRPFTSSIKVRRSCSVDKLSQPIGMILPCQAVQSDGPSYAISLGCIGDTLALGSPLHECPSEETRVLKKIGLKDGVIMSLVSLLLKIFCLRWRPCVMSQSHVLVEVARSTRLIYPSLDNLTLITQVALGAV